MRLAGWFVLPGLVVAAGTYAAYTAYERWLDRPLAIERELTLEIQPGETVRSVAARLGAQGALDRPQGLVLHARLSGQAAGIRAGEYRVTSAHTPRSLFADFVAGRVVTYDVRIDEGGTLAGALSRLRGTATLVDDLEGATPDTLLARLGLGAGPGEGLFFPDTYHFERGTRMSTILRIAHARMDEVLAAEWNARSKPLPLASPYEALVLASVIEKETGRDADRGKISRVFNSRLERGRRLQSDPTVIYGLGTAFDGNLTRAHLQTDGPYNTYRRGGLPPTPIALPGRASIEAAVHPESGDYLYFVARGDGTSEFSRTLAAHEDAVRRYQIEKARQRETP
jgi:UPF0755 protein